MVTQAEPTSVVAYVDFSLRGLLRFLSHRELLNLFARAAARAGVPVRFSQGWNPHPKVSLPLPRSVGMACPSDLLRLELAQPMAAGELADRLGRELPEGLAVRRVRLVRGNRRFPQAAAVTWEADLAGLTPPDFGRRVEAVRSAERVPVARPAKDLRRPSATVNVKEFLLELTADGDRLLAQVAVTPAGSIRPTELFEVLGVPARPAMGRLVRTGARWCRDDYLTDGDPT